MTNTKSNYQYQVGGSLDGDAPSYVTRQADVDFYQALKSGQFCYVLNSRQMGKSSLRVRTMQKLQAEGTVCVFIDLTGMGKQDVTPEKWYAGIVQSLVSSCQLTSKIKWRIWWRERRDLLSPVQCLSLFIEEILLVEIKENIVIFVDEIDRVLSHNFSLDDFFGLIRYFYEQRDTHFDYKRLTFALLGVATPSDLIQDKIQTPFNIGKAIQLQGFQFDEVQSLIDGLEGKIDHPETVIKEILDWTGGQPFLTQKLCQLIIRAENLPLTPNFNNLETQPHNINNNQQNIGKENQENTELIKQVIQSRIVKNWEAQDEPEHLRTIRDRILRNEQKAVQLLGLYQKILQQREIRADGSPEQMELRLSGLVVEDQGQIKVYNPIYKTVFDKKWVDRNLEKLRPYFRAIAAWMASGGQDESSLLQGLELQDALTWALGKSLSDGDYQFLVASQDLAKQQTQKLLEATEQASHLLALARLKATQEVLKRRIWWGWMPLTALAVTASILLLRFCGILQGLEWNQLDLFFRWRSPETPDTRIAIVTIDETDLSQIGQWPIPDGILAQAIANIKAQNPQAIGLDLYRDLPVTNIKAKNPGHRELVKILQSTPNLFGIEKVIENPVAASPVLSKLGQVGFADLVVDGDGKVRRALLSVILSDNKVRYSLAVKMALHYLEAEGITLKPLDSEGLPVQGVRLGKAIFKRFTGNDGGYVHTQSGGYQILLNFRGNQDNFSTFSLRELLENKIPPDSLRDRLVFIGTTAESINDLFYTPYSSRLFRSPERMPGIVLHANIASQIISSAIDGRPLLRVWSDPLEWLWITAIAFVGTVISWQFKFIRAISFSLLVASSGLLAGCYLAFMLGWWLPFVPSFLALSGATVVLFVITNKQRDRLHFRLTLSLLLETYQKDLTTGRIAIEYLKQSESRENQAFIEQKLAD
ncbi:CHASE2 domain-containing protein [Aphanothece sacrum]|uniref:WD40 repeat-containing protein n=1 Tax=Aphanothece sacrum FPU1 TaxID=1920663 RepID=A0A401IBH3_APHSA|nr:CHASE2 domain-containing protein [Aphanothece sacrum]GBF78628.1 WD40 repeat-containing protein [Aphanothece sacrum FPU1]GBF84862.1 WD repeat-containing protein [Aphanothece sacrum FPU3]